MEMINRVQIQGIVTAGILRGVARTGSGWIRFDVRINDDLFYCVAFGDIEGDIGDSIVPDAPVYIEGELKTGRFKGRRSMSVNVLHCRFLDEKVAAREVKRPAGSKPCVGSEYRDRALARNDIPPL